ncbi:hypothetical protein BHE97_13290 [Aeromicrobium sp. PE09-221]|uniref:hypothetical protein n=1 Tax=Aeromicrobium sp. PE09-221 TaxID=1898043 RepID=UPI000B3ED7C8|nr:hypothetical protein [Aeromicrobium sp. PE09-221]OUZ08640.1 hypothetical protein BHE97_13290 [Aeromicrobium sp. PE09-221]
MRRVPTVVWCITAIVALLVGWGPVAVASASAERARGELELYEHWADETVVVSGRLVEVGRSQEVLTDIWDTPVTYLADLRGEPVLVATSLQRKTGPSDVPERLQLRVAPGRVHADEVAAVQSGRELESAEDLAQRQVQRVEDSRTTATLIAGMWWVAAAAAVVGLLLIGRVRGAAGFAGERDMSAPLGRYDAVDRAARSTEFPLVLGSWALLTCLAGWSFTNLPAVIAWVALTGCVLAGTTVREVRALRTLVLAPPGIVRRRRRGRAIGLRALGMVPLLMGALLLATVAVMASTIGPEVRRELTLGVMLAVVGMALCAAAVAQSRVPQAPVIPPRANSGTLRAG